MRRNNYKPSSDFYAMPAYPEYSWEKVDLFFWVQYAIWKWIYLFICTLMIIFFSGQVQCIEDMSSHTNTHILTLMSILCAKLFDIDKGTPEQRLEMWSELLTLSAQRRQGVGRQDIHAVSHGRRSLPRVPVKGSFPSPWRLLWPVFCQRHSMDRFVSGRPLRVNCVIYWREENCLLGNQKHFLQFITRIFNTNGKIWKSC